MHRIQVGWIALLGSVLLVAAQCGGQPNEIGLELGADGTVESGGTFAGTLSVVRKGRVGPVQVVLRNPPAGITMPAVALPESASSAPFTISVGPGVSPGLKDLLFEASSGNLIRTEPWKLRVIQPTPDFVLNPNPSSLTTPPGERAVLELALERRNGFAGAVELSLDSPPAGIAIGAQTPAIPAGADRIQLQLAVDGSVAPGSYNLTLRGTSGVLSRTAALRLTVTPAPDFGLALVPTTLSVAQGSSGNVTVNLTRQNGFAGAVEVSLLNPPSGVGAATLILAPGSNSGQFTLDVSAAAALGNQTLTVQGVGLGQTRTATLNLNVTVGSSFAVGLQFGPNLSRNQGSASRSNLTITRSGGFTGAVTLALEGAILGSGSSQVQHSFGTNPDAGNGSWLDLVVGSSVPEGTYPLVLRGTSGSLQSTYNINLTVTRPSFRLSLNPEQVTVPRGQSRTITVNITRDPGFTSPIQFVTATIGGLTQTFSPNPAPGDSTILTISAATDAPLGTYFPTMGSTNQNPNVNKAYRVTVVQPDFTISVVNPASPTVARLTMPNGNRVRTSSRDLNVSVTPLNGFEGVVSFSVSDLPEGASFSGVNAQPGSTYNLRITLDSSVAPGDYPIRIVGSNAPLGLSKTVPFTLRVQLGERLWQDFSGSGLSGWASDPSTGWRNQGGAATSRGDWAGGYAFLSSPSFPNLQAFPCDGDLVLTFTSFFGTTGSAALSVYSFNGVFGTSSTPVSLSYLAGGIFRNEQITLDKNYLSTGGDARLFFDFRPSSTASSESWGVDNVLVACR